MYTADPEGAALHMYEVTGPLDQVGDLPPVIDAEIADLDGSLVRRFADALEFYYGRVPIVYTYPAVGQSIFGGDSSWRRYPLWIAHYGVSWPWIPSPWQDSDMFLWQIGGGPVSGIYTGDVDFNTIMDRGKLNELAGYSYGISPSNQQYVAPVVKEEEVYQFRERSGLYFDWPGLGQAQGMASDSGSVKSGDRIVAWLNGRDPRPRNVTLLKPNGSQSTALMQWGLPAVFTTDQDGWHSVVYGRDAEGCVVVEGRG